MTSRRNFIALLGAAAGAALLPLPAFAESGKEKPFLAELKESPQAEEWFHDLLITESGRRNLCPLLELELAGALDDRRAKIGLPTTKIAEEIGDPGFNTGYLAVIPQSMLEKPDGVDAFRSSMEQAIEFHIKEETESPMKRIPTRLSVMAGQTSFDFDDRELVGFTIVQSYTKA